MPKRKECVDFWESLEAQCAAAGLRNKVPASMKKLLTLTGYNSSWSFKCVSNEKLREAEDFIEKYYRKEADEFEEYKDMKPFQFIPGHKEFIFGIKEEINESQQTKKPKISKKSNALSENDIKMSLLVQMSAFSKRLGLTADWSNSIIESEYTGTESATFCTCTVSCPIVNCGSNHIVRYDKYWKNSNLCKHVRKHVQPSMQPNSEITATDRSERGNEKENNNGSNQVHLSGGTSTNTDNFAVSYNFEEISISDNDKLDANDTVIC